MVRINFGKDIFPIALIAGIICLASCVDHAEEDLLEQEIIREDSISQSILDQAAFDAYIADSENEINGDDVVIQDDGVRHVIWEPSTSLRSPAVNDIVSVHYSGKFTDNVVFDTTDPVIAKKSDSVNYVSEGISFENLMNESSKTYEELLDSLNASEGAINDPLFSLDRLYLPMVFNHQLDGSGISFGFISGFRSGLEQVMLGMELGSRSLIMIPSAVAYGVLGTINTDGSQGIPPNTPLIFEFRLVNIRP